MSRLMQLPSLFIRGSIATQTMRNLDPDNIARVNQIVKKVRDDPSLAADRHEFNRQLSITIKADYKSDRDTADQEFTVAIWRGTVHLLYHRDYEYMCSLCGAASYTTSLGKPIDFDRQYKICPSCSKSWYNHEGRNYAVEVGRIGDRYKLVGVGEGADNLLIQPDFDDREAMEKAIHSPVQVVGGAQKVINPEMILGDPVQRGKWYTVWIWNYFRQILKENIIKTHNKHQTDICGAADKIAFQHIINELKRGKYRYSYDESALYSHRPLDISVDVLATTPDFSLFLYALTREYRSHNVNITTDRNKILVKATGPVPMVNATIEMEDPVVVLSYGSPSGDNDDRGWSDIIESNIDNKDSRPHIKIYDGELERLISDDAMISTRDELDPEAKVVFDIYTQTGDTWSRFASQWGEATPRKVHIARFLNVSTKQIDYYKQQIMTQALVNNLKTPMKPTVSNKVLSRQLREAEDDACRSIPGDIFVICILYRYMCRFVVRVNKILGYHELPQELRAKIKRDAHTVIAARLARYLRW